MTVMPGPFSLALLFIDARSSSSSVNLETTLPANEILAIGMFISFIALVFTGLPSLGYLADYPLFGVAVVLEADFHLQQVWTGVIPH